MSLSVVTNVSSLNAQRNASSVGQGLTRSLQRLSTGLRINNAADDAAGLAIAERMTSGIRGMNAAKRNINDGASLLQTADGALAQVTASLQRLRELAVQAGNSTYSVADRAFMQDEANQILAQISQVGKQTSFNGEAVFAQDTTSIGGDAAKRFVLDGLKSGWLRESEKLIEKYYGLTGEGSKLTVDLDSFTDGGSNVLAMVEYNMSGTHNILRVDMADFTPTNAPDGGGAPMYSDRIIAHEMVHAVMASSTFMFSLPQWFIEGTAELIHGADERVAGAVGGGGAAAVVASVAGGFSYEGSYVASRYLHDQLKEMGVEGGIKGIMTYLGAHKTENLSQALNAVTNGVYADTNAFVADFSANGVDFINNKMDLTNADTGAIGGLDADGGPSRNAKDVVFDAGDRGAPDVLEGFAEVFPEIGGSTGRRQVQIQVGASANDHIMLDLTAMNAAALGLADLDLESTSNSIRHIDEALEFVNTQRTVIGASTARLESAASSLATGVENLSASRARILDADYASETASLTRSQILQQAATAMIAQANNQPSAVLALLR